jgi:hypothetical protein
MAGNKSAKRQLSGKRRFCFRMRGPTVISERYGERMISPHLHFAILTLRKTNSPGRRRMIDREIVSLGASDKCQIRIAPRKIDSEGNEIDPDGFSAHRLLGYLAKGPINGKLRDISRVRRDPAAEHLVDRLRSNLERTSFALDEFRRREMINNKLAGVFWHPQTLAFRFGSEMNTRRRRQLRSPRHESAKRPGKFRGRKPFARTAARAFVRDLIARTNLVSWALRSSLASITIRVCVRTASTLISHCARHQWTSV